MVAHSLARPRRNKDYGRQTDRERASVQSKSARLTNWPLCTHCMRVPRARVDRKGLLSWRLQPNEPASERSQFPALPISMCVWGGRLLFGGSQARERPPLGRKPQIHNTHMRAGRIVENPRVCESPPPPHALLARASFIFE